MSTFLNNDRLTYINISEKLDPLSINNTFTGCVKLSKIRFGDREFEFTNLTVISFCKESAPSKNVVS